MFFHKCFYDKMLRMVLGVVEMGLVWTEKKAKSKDFYIV